jgi:putative Mg2+ transporter-C (MgtC) family protein
MIFPETEIIQLALSAVLGGVIGAEREYKNKSAGFRTLMLICVGSCLFTILSTAIGKDSTDRIASNIVTGIGFLGAGVIFKSGSDVKGLTTAASIWVVAAVGMTVGGGYYFEAIIASVMVLIILYIFIILENWIEKTNQVRTYRIVSEYDLEHLYKYEELMKENKLRFKRINQRKIGREITGNWIVMGNEKKHRLFTDSILKDETVKEFDF